MELGIEQCRGILPRRHHPRVLAHQPVQARPRRGEDQGEPRQGTAWTPSSRSAGRHLGVATKLSPTSASTSGRAQDDRQRPVGHRLHLRLRHRGQHRDRGHRPAPHDRRVPPPGPRGRGDGAGTPAGSRCTPGSPAAPTSSSSPSSPSTSTRSARWSRAASSPTTPRSWSSEGAVPREGGSMTLVSGELDEFGHVRLGGIGDRLAQEIESRTGKEARAVVLGHIQRGRHAHRVRPVARHPVRPPGDRRGGRRRLRHHDDARHRHRAGAAHRGHRRAEAGEPAGVRRGAGLLVAALPRRRAGPKGGCSTSGTPGA